MARTVLAVLFLVMSAGIAYPQAKLRVSAPKAVVVAFIDPQRLSGTAGDATLEDFEFFLKQVQDIVKRDFPNVKLTIVRNGELVRLPDGWALNPRNVQPEVGYVLSIRGKRHQLLSGVQTDADFACAASAYFHRHSAACPK